MRQNRVHRSWRERRHVACFELWAVVITLLFGATTAWGQCSWVQSHTLTAEDGAEGDGFGRRVAISDAVAIVGASRDDDYTGSAYLFDVATGQQIHKLTAEDGVPEDRFGFSVSVSGQIALVGAVSDWDPKVATHPGSAYLFDVVTGQQLHKLTSDDNDLFDQFGASVSVSGDIALVGANGDGPGFSGAAYVFDVPTGQQKHKLTIGDGYNDFGWSVSVSDGIAIVGAFSADSAYLFDAVTGQQLHELNNDGWFGLSVSIDGDYAIVGAPFNGVSGAAFLFNVMTGQQLHKLTNEDAQPDHWFGASVGLSGSLAIASTDPDYCDGCPRAAYLFDMVTGVQLHQLTADDADRDVAISGGVVIVGASGSAHLFRAEVDCNGDTDGDGVVGVDDLAGVILAWGTDDSGADVDENGLVDVDDLLQVILSWGECSDCNANCVRDSVEIADGSSTDCDGNGVPDECDVGSGASQDCNTNLVPDECDIAEETSFDCDGDGVPDECDDCNGNGLADTCDLDEGTSLDCNGNGIPDECDVASGTSEDCNGNGLPDDCENDCNCNGLDDQIDIKSGASGDCDDDGVPDECDAPSNDACGNASTLGAGVHAFCVSGATAVGPDEPECSPAIEADVWFRHLSSCDGLLTITVDASFVPGLLIYSGPCPSSPGQAIACGATTGPNQASVTVAVSAGTLLRMRVGSTDGSDGHGTITLACD
jgi:hypothetical protein